MEPCTSIDSAVRGANLVVIMNNHPLFARTDLGDLAHAFGRPCLVYDFWNNFNGAELVLPDHVGYMSLGCAGKAKLPRGCPELIPS